MRGVLVTEVEHLEQISDRRAVAGYVWIVAIRDRISQVVAAARGHRRQHPITLDKLQNRNVVIIRMDYPAAGRERGNNDKWDARSITEEVQRLDVAGVVVAAAFIEGDEHRRLPREFPIGVEPVEENLQHRFEEIDLGTGWMPVEHAVGFDK